MFEQYFKDIWRQWNEQFRKKNVIREHSVFRKILQVCVAHW